MSATLVLGMGRSGQAAAALLQLKGITPVCLDMGNACDPQGRPCRTELPDGPIDQAIVSPGIPDTHPWIVALRRRRVPCISELELGWQHCGFKTLAVTGSLGKTSIVTAAVKILQAAGMSAMAAGNIGLPVSRVATDVAHLDWLVLEVSSFQLETTRRFAPNAAVLLNIVPNHLDRHGSMSRYTALKLRLFEQMPPRSPRIVPAKQPGQFIAVMEPVSRARYQDGYVLDGDHRIDLRDSMFDDPVLGPNAAALCAALLRMQIPVDAIELGFAEMEPLRHRMETIGQKEGVTFVNDAKSTCLEATAGALQRTSGTVRLIAGGRSKTDDFSSLKTCFDRTSAVYLFGESSGGMAASWQGKVDCVQCGDLRVAVERAYADSQPGDCILLSPGCASFDQFASYEARGDAFVDLFGALREKKIEISS